MNADHSEEGKLRKPRSRWVESRTAKRGGPERWGPASIHWPLLRVVNPTLGYHNTLHLTLRDDRSAEWTLEAFDDDLEEAPTTRIAATIAAILNTPTPPAR